MKALKISLAVIVVAAICIFVIKAIVPPKCDKCNKNLKECICIDIDIDTDNPFVIGIRKQINDLQNKPDNKFCKKEYNSIEYDILMEYNNKNLGTGQDNEKWKNRLLLELFREYSDKFIKQALYIFDRNEWKKEDLDIISGETARLEKNSYNEKNGAFQPDFIKFRQILNQYNKINKFITECNDFEYLDTILDARFPVSEVRDKLSNVATYQNNNLGNEYVNNCTRLHNELKGIPEKLYNEHYNYLRNKIWYWEGKYKNRFNSDDAYKKAFFAPMEEELEKFEEIFKKDDYSFFNKQNYNDLKYKLEFDEYCASLYFQSKKANKK